MVYEIMNAFTWAYYLFKALILFNNTSNCHILTESDSDKIYIILVLSVKNKAPEYQSVTLKPLVGQNIYLHF